MSFLWLKHDMKDEIEEFRRPLTEEELRWMSEHIPPQRASKPKAKPAGKVYNMGRRVYGN